MFRIITILIIALGLVACGGGDGSDHSHGSDKGSHAHGSDAGSGSHDGHDHGSGHDGHDHDGHKHELGEGTYDGVTVVATQVGDIKDGELIVMVKISAGHEKVTAIRAWVGNEDGKGSVKVKGNKMDGGKAYDFHIEVPATITEGMQTYIEVVTEKGPKPLGFDLEQHEHEHDGEGSEDHDHEHEGEGSGHDDDNKGK